MPFRFDSSGLDTIVCLLHNLSAGKMWSNFFFFYFFFPLLLSTRRSYLRLSVSRNQCIRCRFHCELRGRDSDCDGFACFFFNWAMCKWGVKNRFRCLVHSRWFRRGYENTLFLLRRSLMRAASFVPRVGNLCTCVCVCVWGQMLEHILKMYV